MRVEEEWLCMIKTSKGKFRDLENELNRVHLYELPELIALSIEDGSGKYLKWIVEI